MPKLLLFSIVAFIAMPALATDGVLEINQTCAVQTGCFPGDAAGFPVTIDGSAGSSYLLTSDLTVPDANTTGIMVNTSLMTVDLGGHRVTGPVTCTGTTPIVCTPAGTGRGVVTGPVTGVRIRNGTVTGMGDLGVGTNSAGSIDDVLSFSNAGIGIFVGPGSTVDRSRAAGNGGDGIAGATGVRVTSSVALQNGGDGIDVGDGSTVRGVYAEQNFEDGIHTGRNATISDSSALNNGSDGIFGRSGAIVTSCQAASNGANGISGGEQVGGQIFLAEGMIVSNSRAASNGGNGIAVRGTVRASGNTLVRNLGDGIETVSGSVVGNVISGNTGYGIELLGSGASFRDNDILFLIGGTGFTSGGLDAGGNVCNGSLTCP
jgi:hypothetical protein